MKKKLLLSTSALMLLLGGLCSCGGDKEEPTVNPTVDIPETNIPSIDIPETNPNTNTPDLDPTEGMNDLDKDRYKIYLLALESGFSGSYQEWVSSITGDKIELRVQSGKIEWRYSKENTWMTLVSLEDLVGPEGKPGSEIELGVSGTHIQWRYKGSDSWTNLIALEAIRGPEGKPGSTSAKGQSAYEIAVEAGFKGSEKEWLQSLKGTDGLSAYEIYLKYHPEYSKTEEEWINDLASGTLVDNKHTVSFNTNSKTEIAPVVVYDGHKLMEPEKPLKEGYIFDGWYLNGERWSFIGYTVTADITLEARWKCDDIAISVVTTKGDEILSGHYKYGDKIQLEAPKYLGYVFTRFVDSDGNLVDDGYTATHSTAITAYYREMTDEEKLNHDLDKITIPEALNGTSLYTIGELDFIKDSSNISLEADNPNVEIMPNGVIRVTALANGSKDVVITAKATLNDTVVEREFKTVLNAFSENPVSIKDAKSKLNNTYQVRGVISSVVYDTNNEIPCAYYLTDSTGTLFIANYDHRYNLKVKQDVTIDGYISEFARNESISLNYISAYYHSSGNEIPWNSDNLKSATVSGMINDYSRRSGDTYDIIGRVTINDMGYYCLSDLTYTNEYVMEYLSGNGEKPTIYASLLKEHLGEAVKARFIVNGMAGNGKVRGNVATLIPLTDDEILGFAPNEIYSELQALNINDIYGSRVITLPATIKGYDKVQLTYTINDPNASITGNSLAITSPDMDRSITISYTCSINGKSSPERAFTINLYKEITKSTIAEALAKPNNEMVVVEGKVVNINDDGSKILYDGTGLILAYYTKPSSLRVGDYACAYGSRTVFNNVNEIAVKDIFKITDGSVGEAEALDITADELKAYADLNTPAITKRRMVSGKLSFNGSFYNLTTSLNNTTITLFTNKSDSYNAYVGLNVMVDAYFVGATSRGSVRCLVNSITPLTDPNEEIAKKAEENITRRLNIGVADRIMDIHINQKDATIEVIIPEGSKTLTYLDGILKVTPLPDFNEEAITIIIKAGSVSKELAFTIKSKLFEPNPLEPGSYTLTTIGNVSENTYINESKNFADILRLDEKIFNVSGAKAMNGEFSNEVLLLPSGEIRLYSGSNQSCSLTISTLQFDPKYKVVIEDIELVLLKGKKNPSFTINGANQEVVYDKPIKVNVNSDSVEIKNTSTGGGYQLKLQYIKINYKIEAVNSNVDVELP